MFICQQRPMNCAEGALDDEELFIIRGLEKLALNSGTTRRSAKNAEKTAKSPFIAVTHAESVSVSVAAGLSADSGDDLNLGHRLRDTVAARSQGRPHLVDELQQQGHRPPCQKNATAEPQLSALSDQIQSFAHQPACRRPSKKLHLEISGLLHSLHCEPCLCEATVVATTLSKN